MVPRLRPAQSLNCLFLGDLLSTAGEKIVGPTTMEDRELCANIAANDPMRDTELNCADFKVECLTDAESKLIEASTELNPDNDIKVEVLDDAKLNGTMATGLPSAVHQIKMIDQSSQQTGVASSAVDEDSFAFKPSTEGSQEIDADLAKVVWFRGSQDQLVNGQEGTQISPVKLLSFLRPPGASAESFQENKVDPAKFLSFLRPAEGMEERNVDSAAEMWLRGPQGQMAALQFMSSAAAAFGTIPHEFYNQPAAMLQSYYDALGSMDEHSMFNKWFKCDHRGCGATFTRASHIAEHKRIHTGEKPYKCDHEGCRAAFSSSSGFFSHKRTHTKEQQFKCNFDGCAAAFSRPYHLTEHRRIHTGEKPYKCDFAGCGAAFTSSPNLTKHIRRHTGEKPYKCEFEGCFAAFTGSSSLIKHRRKHTGEKPYKCDYPGCEAAFIQTANLVVHKRIHTGEKPYICRVEGCKAAFTGYSHLQLHTRKHTGEKPYACGYVGCNAAFTQSCDLTKHTRKHTGEKPYKCDFDGCTTTFTCSSSLSKHKKKHNEVKVKANHASFRISPIN